MSQRMSGYPREIGDFYETPAWVTQALAPHLRAARSIWDPAAGKGSMTKVMATWPGVMEVRGTDVSSGLDFLSCLDASSYVHDAIVTNPPYNMAQDFIEQALKLTKRWRGRVAMLLRTDFDHAKTRQHLFGACPEFSRKLVLTSRIRWYAGSTGSPSFNHAWFVWDWTHLGPPTLRYHYDEPIELPEASSYSRESGQVVPITTKGV